MRHTLLMKKLFLKSPILVGLLTLTACFSNAKEQSLYEITKPYLGQYECKEVKLGKKDYLAKFEYIDLELKADNTFVVRYKEEGEKEEILKGEYRYDAEKEKLYMTGKGGFKREIPLKNGELFITVPIGRETLHIIFSKK